MRTTWLVIALAACGGSKEGGADWSSRPLQVVTGKVGYDSVSLSFTLEIPHGLAPEARATEGITVGYEATPHDFKAPAVMIGYEAIPPKSLDEAVTDSMPGEHDEIVRKDAIDGGYIVTTRGPSHKHWKVNVIKVIGDKGIGCMAQQANDDAELGETSRALLETICLSLAVAGSRR